MKRSTSLLILSALVISTATPAAYAASNRVGGPCKTVNQKVKIGSVSATCSKVGSKLIWKKSPIAKAATQSPSPASPATSSASPSVTAKASSAPSAAAQSGYSIAVSTGSWFFNFSYFRDGVKGALKSSPVNSSTLLLPAGKLVTLTLTNSSDVPHGFWIPGLLIDKEVLPGNKASVEFTPDKVGTYPSSCNISCGRGHGTMTFSVEVVSESDYLKFLAGLKG